MSDELFNRQAETIFLSGLLRYPDEYHSLNESGIVPSDLGGRENKTVLSAIIAVAEDKRSPDVASVIESLRGRGSGGSEPYLSRLQEVPCSLAQAKDAAETVKGLAVSRALVDLGVKTIEKAKEHRSDYEAALSEVEVEFAGIRKGLPRGATMSTGIDSILADLRNSEQIAGIPLRFSPSLQHITGGLVPGWLWVIGGFSSVGKSAVACNFIIDVARAGKSVGVISTEMPRESYAIRLLSNLSGVPQRNIRERVALGENIQKIHDAEEQLSKANIRIFDTVYDLRGIRSMATRMAKMETLDVLIVDFIQNLGGTGDEVSDARTSIIGLQELAKELRCTVIAFSQISNDMAMRQSEGSAGDYYSFKGHGAIRDAADVAIMLKRDQQGQSPFLEARVVKNRHESLGKITWKMDLPTGRIEEHTSDV
jgi:replicative DNA helicase